MVCSENGKFISSPLKGFNIRIKAKCMRVKNILAPDFENLNCDPLSEVYYQPPTKKDKKNRRPLTAKAKKSRVVPTALSPALWQIEHPSAPVLPKAPAFYPPLIEKSSEELYRST